MATAAPAPSEPPPPAGAAATAATRYERNVGGTSEREGRVGSTNERRRVRASAGGMNEHEGSVGCSNEHRGYGHSRGSSGGCAPLVPRPLLLPFPLSPIFLNFFFII